MSKKRSENVPFEDPIDDGSPFIELDPENSESSESNLVQAAESSLGTVIPEQGFLDARDELHRLLGGAEAIASTVQESAIADAGIGLENIQGIGIGIRKAGQSYTGELAVKVFVVEKVPMSKVHPSCAIPTEVNGYPVDVEDIGEINSFVYTARYARPVPCGVSCGETHITAGTIGCLVVLNNNKLCILSNNHVLANVNQAPIGSPIVQPGPLDGGRMPADLIAKLERFIPINFPGPNLVDCAAASTATSLVKPNHVTYRLNPRPVAPSLNLSVMKNGRTTQSTMGLVTAIHVNSVSVNYGNGKIGVFNDQVIIQGIAGRPFSAGGDSGSLIVTSNTHQPVALLFAGSATHTIANPIGNVISALGINRFV